MDNRIINGLQKLFEQHRIVFWYDTKKELRDDFDALSLPDIDKIVLDNNEYSVKYKILREQPTQKFLLYHEGPQPSYLDNWLLDVLLAHCEFRTDQVSIWLSELSLGIEFSEVLQAHAEFFRAKSRKDALNKLIAPDDSSGMMQLKMLAVCSKCEPQLDIIVESLLHELAHDDTDKFNTIKKYQLDTFLWEQMSRHYGYQSDDPSMLDFAIDLFKLGYPMAANGPVRLTGDALVFLKRWKNSSQHKISFEKLSDRIARDLKVKDDLEDREFKDLLELDYYRLIDTKIVSAIRDAVLTSDATDDHVSSYIRQRRQTHWYPDFEHQYQALDYAAQFIAAFNQIDIKMNSLTDGVERYTQLWYKIDQLYRKFIYHLLESKQVSLFHELNERIENLYVNNYLLNLGDSFQEFVESAPHWDAFPVRRQDSFFEQWVQPFLNNNKKVYVIISDAMRYEIADELFSLISQEDRFTANLEPMLSMLPSYTQLGMAALLPHQSLAIADNNSSMVLVDEQSTQGTSSRHNILNTALQGRGQAITATDFMNLGRVESRELLKANDVIYIYHNRIDHTGDDIHTEGQAFVAAEKTLDDLITIIKRLAAANASNVLITADHGFIYQNRKIEESDFSSVKAEGREVLFENRRFILGKGLSHSSSLHNFSSEQLGLNGDVEVQIPKSINRLRRSGSGSRFVHGGASLQEVVIPVLSVNKKRESDVTTVEVEIMRGSKSLITTERLSVTMYQNTAVTEKRQPRILRVGIYTEAGELISDSHELNFDLSSENSRDREQQIDLIITRKIDEVNGQEVTLRLEEKIAGSSHYQVYKSMPYTVRRSFTSDSDF